MPTFNDMLKIALSHVDIMLMYPVLQIYKLKDESEIETKLWKKLYNKKYFSTLDINQRFKNRQDKRQHWVSERLQDLNRPA